MRKFRYLGVAAVPALLGGCATSSSDDTVQDRTQAATEVNTVKQTNVFHGTVGFSNDETNRVSDLLRSRPASHSCSVNARGPSPLSASTTAPSPNGLTCDYVLSAETQPGGVSYDVSASARGGGFNFGLGTQGGNLLEPTADSPDGTEVDVLECAGLTKVTFVDCEGKEVAAPTGVNAGNTDFIARAEDHAFLDVDTLYVAHPDGQTGTIQGTVTVGSDAYDDQMTVPFSVPYSAQCDVIEDRALEDETQAISTCIPVPEDLGALDGPIEVQGETLTGNVFVRATGGPDGNRRYFRDLTAPYEHSLTDPWLLPNMVPGEYRNLYAEGSIREGYAHTNFRAPYTAATVVPSETTTVTDDDGAYPFMLTPGFLQGDVVLTNPLILTEGLGTFGALTRAADNLNADNVPAGGVSGGSYVGATTNDWGYAYSSFGGNMDADTGRLDSSYELPLMSTYDQTRTWNDNLVLRFSRGFDATAPDEFRSGSVTVNPAGSQREIASGETAEQDYNLCFGEVTFMTQLEAGSTLHSPNVSITGNFAGTNGNGAAADYQVGGNFAGYPRTQASSDNVGVVRYTVPEGSYTFTPSAQVVTAAGNVSNVTFSQTSVDVPCGGDVVVNPGLAVNVDLQSACVEELQTSVDVEVASGPHQVDRVWYTINGGDEVELCSEDCGQDPSYELTIASSDLQACANQLRVFAKSDEIAGDGASTAVSLTYEIPGDNIDCPGDCVEPPSAAACLTGTERVDIKDRTSVTADVDAGEFELGADASVNGEVDVDGSAFLRERASVSESVEVEGSYMEQNGVSVGSLVNPADVSIDPLPTAVVAAGSGYQEVPNDAVQTLEPGSYGHMTIRARSTVTLGAGRYDFASLKVEPDVQLVFDTTAGPVELYSEGDVSFESRVRYQIDDPADLSVYSNGASVRLHPEQTFPGSILAPHALVEVYSHVDVQGCIAGRHVRIEPDSSLVGTSPVVVGGGGTDPECQSDADCAAGSCQEGVCVSAGGDLGGTLTMTSNWESGYCADVVVSNPRNVVVSDWEVLLDLGGSSIRDSWNTSLSGSTGQVTALPVSHNASLSPGASAQFGFCADKSAPADAPALVSINER